uniref:Uncharacterized protein n=1 Tax=Nelumbo nucifera TaxID=4432 RepID=A0A822YHE9_NELNU|nr:TPA_asm: hypothetical protein HUJ06_010723 [Nelumbo nucifera]
MDSICWHVDEALVFKVNLLAPTSNNFTLRIVVRITENSVVTITLGHVPRLGFSMIGQPLLRFLVWRIPIWLEVRRKRVGL